MKYDEFIGQVQHHARVATPGEALKATQATLEVLGQRLHGGEADDLAAQLPEELQQFLKGGERSESFDLDTFFERVSAKEGVDMPVAVQHARAVTTTVKEAVTAGEWEDILAQMPAEYRPLFESGADGEMS